MTIIKIVKGVFGYKKNNSIIPKDKNSEAFEVDDTTAKRLISLGVAVKSDNIKSVAAKPVKYSSTRVSLAPEESNVVDKTKETAEADDACEDEETVSTPKYSMKNTRNELLELAKKVGFEGSDEAIKKELIEFLDSVYAVVESEDDDTPQIGDDAGVVE